jgi:hypothetical protein
MAKKSRKRIGAAGAVLALALPVCSAISGGAAAGGLPLRADASTRARASDRALAGLAENLDFKLSRFDQKAPPVGLEAWSAMVDETVLIAGRLGVPAGTPVTAQRLGDVYAVVLEGDSVIAGPNPDLVLGRLLFTLTHAAPDSGKAPAAAALAVLDQPLSATLAALPFTSSP